MRSLLLIACLVAFAALAYGYGYGTDAEDNCNLEVCQDNSECQALNGPCTVCKVPRSGGGEKKCVKPGPCRQHNCESDEDCALDDGEKNPCPICKPNPNGEGGFCRPEGTGAITIYLFFCEC